MAIAVGGDVTELENRTSAPGGACSSVFEGVLSPEQTGSYIYHPFDVPPGTTAIRLRLRYTPFRVSDYCNQISLGLFDPHGFRGQAHRAPPPPTVIVSASTATPGFFPGPLPAGRWLAELALHLVLPGTEPCRYALGVETLVAGTVSSGDSAWRSPVWQAVHNRAGWYRGELHAHTRHSDGNLTLAQLLALARTRGLDFVALADHNTVSGWGELASTAADGVLVIPSMEFTTFRGHAVALGLDRWLDWRVGLAGYSMADAAAATRAAGGLFIIAHPQAIGSPVCTGCRWEYDEFDLSLADGVEVWSGPWRQRDAYNRANLRLWQELQTQGRRLTAVAAGDLHYAADWREGVPFTYVYADELSVPAILHGIRQGRVVISNGPWLDLQATSEGRAAGVGETLVATGSSIHLQAAWKDAPAGARLRWWAGTILLGEEKVGGNGVAARQVDVGSEDRLWVELWSGHGSLLAMTNPCLVLICSQTAHPLASMT